MTDSPTLPFRSPLLMNADDTAVVIVDVQSKLLPVIDQSEDLIRQIKTLIEGAQLLDVPVFYTQQYPEGLGHTVNDLLSGNAEVDSSATFDKRMFSFRQCGELFQRLKNRNIRNVVIAGIESHICVLQSALDSVAYGFDVFVVADAVGSRRPVDRSIALSRLELSGVTLTTVESAVFEWCETSEHPKFKSISKRLK